MKHGNFSRSEGTGFYRPYINNPIKSRALAPEGFFLDQMPFLRWRLAASHYSGTAAAPAPPTLNIFGTRAAGSRQRRKRRMRFRLVPIRGRIKIV